MVNKIFTAVATAAAKAEWRQALLPVHKTMESRVGREFIQAIYKETAALGAK